MYRRKCVATLFTRQMSLQLLWSDGFSSLHTTWFFRDRVAGPNSIPFLHVYEFEYYAFSILNQWYNYIYIGVICTFFEYQIFKYRAHIYSRFEIWNCENLYTARLLMLSEILLFVSLKFWKNIAQVNPQITYCTTTWELLALS